jgi:hypothetical protein
MKLSGGKKMHRCPAIYVRALAACLCASLLLYLLAVTAAADVETQIKPNVGQPNVRSLYESRASEASILD